MVAVLLFLLGLLRSTAGVLVPWASTRGDPQNSGKSPWAVSSSPDLVRTNWTSSGLTLASTLLAQRSPVLIDQNTAVFVVVGGRAVAVQLSSPTVRWTFDSQTGLDCSSDFIVEPSGSYGFLSCGSQVFRVNLSTGVSTNNAYHAGAAVLSIFPYTSACCLVAAQGPQVVYAYDFNLARVGVDLSPSGTVKYPPAFSSSGAVVFMGVDNSVAAGAVRAFPLSTSGWGGQLWSYSTTPNSAKWVSVAPSGSVWAVVDASNFSFLVRLDPTTGAELARLTLSQPFKFSSAPAFEPTNGLGFVMMDSGTTCKFNALSSGTISCMTEFSNGGTAVGGVLLDASGMLLAPWDFYVQGIQISSSTEVWASIGVNNLVTGTAINCDGSYVFGDGGSRVYAFGLPQPGNCAAQTRTRTKTKQTRTRSKTNQTRTRSKTKQTRTRSKTKQTRTRTRTRTMSKRTQTLTHTRTITKRTHTGTISPQTETRTMTKRTHTATRWTRTRTRTQGTRTRTETKQTRTATGHPASRTATLKTRTRTHTRTRTQALTPVQLVARAVNTTLLALTASSANAPQSLAEIAALLAVLAPDATPADTDARHSLRTCLVDAASASLGVPRDASASVGTVAAQLDVVEALAGYAGTREIGTDTAAALCGLVSSLAADGAARGLAVAEAEAVLVARYQIEQVATATTAGPVAAPVACPAARGVAAAAGGCLAREAVLSLVSTAVADPSGAPVQLAVGGVVIIVQQSGAGNATSVAVPGTSVTVVIPASPEATVSTVVVYPPGQNPNSVANGTQTVNLGSVVVSITITTANGTIVQPAGGVSITIPPAPGLGVPEGGRCGAAPTCSYFDEAAGVWRSDGLTTNIVRDSSGQITGYECTTPHLTDFAVLLLAEEGCESVFAQNQTLFAVFAALFGAVLAVAVVQSGRAVVHMDAGPVSAGTTTARLRVAMLVSAAAGLLCRVVYTASAASGAIDSASVVALAVLLSLPYYFLFLAFVFVVAQWANMGSASKSLTGKSKAAIGVAIAVVSGLLVALLVGSATAPSRAAQKQAAEVCSYLIAGICIGLAVAFLVYGGRIVILAGRFASQSSKQVEVQRKLFSVICVYSVSFVVEACLWVYSMIALDTFAAHFTEFYAVFLSIELVTYITLLLATRKFQTSSSSGSSSSRASSQKSGLPLNPLSRFSKTSRA